jgi:catechol 2,3-dioxygenase-like lactoylglutathione lyase family enzyme
MAATPGCAGGEFLAWAGILMRSSKVPCHAGAVATLRRIAPIFAVRDLDAATEHYQRLGFSVRAYAGGGYGFASRDGVEIHLGVVPDDRHRTSSAYLFVDNADDLAAAWGNAGVEVEPPQDTEWSQHEGAVVDPDGNVIRFGSPMPKEIHGTGGG